MRSIGLYEISNSKFSMILKRGFIVFLGCFSGSIKRAEPDGHIIYSDLSLPPPSSFPIAHKCHSAKSRGIIFPYPKICSILTSGAYSEVFLRIIKSVMIFMVNLFFLRAVGKKSVKEKYREIFSSAAALIRCSIPLVTSFDRVPFKLTDFIGVNIVNNCDLSLREWYYNHPAIVPFSDLYPEGYLHWPKIKPDMI